MFLFRRKGGSTPRMEPLSLEIPHSSGQWPCGHRPRSCDEIPFVRGSHAGMTRQTIARACADTSGMPKCRSFIAVVVDCKDCGATQTPAINIRLFRDLVASGAKKFVSHLFNACAFKGSEKWDVMVPNGSPAAQTWLTGLFRDIAEASRGAIPFHRITLYGGVFAPVPNDADARRLLSAIRLLSPVEIAFPCSVAGRHAPYAYVGHVRLQDLGEEAGREFMAGERGVLLTQVVNHEDFLAKGQRAFTTAEFFMAALLEGLLVDDPRQPVSVLLKSPCWPDGGWTGTWLESFIDVP